ncbi:hypothetical protein TeGR_g6448, partial [Tetraparma gracilis]
MLLLFYDKGSFDEDISGWVTSKVTTMERMFQDAAAFDQDISGWDTSKCTDMRYMFYDAAFSQDISPWCVALISSEPSSFGYEGTDPSWGEACTSCTTGADGFECQNGGVAFDGYEGPNCETKMPCPSDFSCSNGGVVDTSGFLADKTCCDCSTAGGFIGSTCSMCTAATVADAGIPQYTGDVTTMWNLFVNKGSFNEDISGWDTSKVTTMEMMFVAAAAFDQDISGWDTSKCTSMNFMFYNAAAFDQDISGWDTSKCTDMDYMFDGATAFSQDLSPWCVALISSEPSGFDKAGADPNW